MKAKPPSKNTGLLWIGAAEAPRKAPGSRQDTPLCLTIVKANGGARGTLQAGQLTSVGAVGCHRVVKRRPSLHVVYTYRVDQLVYARDTHHDHTHTRARARTLSGRRTGKKPDSASACLVFAS